MYQYVFIIGRNPELSVAEIRAVLPNGRVVEQTSSFLIVETTDEIDGGGLLQQLGGTIKVGRVISETVNKDSIVESLKKISSSGKLQFGISFYDTVATKLGMEIKKELKNAGISCRLVTSRDKALSSVVVTKNKVHEFLILKNKYIGQTQAVQAFEDYSSRDYGRPVRDTKAGTLPPKLAKIIINLAQQPHGATLLDPFCGSGTVIQEALLLGYENIIASDQSTKAVDDTKENLVWLEKELGMRNVELGNRLKSVKIFQTNVKELSKTVGRADAIVTEPYLGPPLHGNERPEGIEKIVSELEALYLAAFKEFAAILGTNGRVVIIFPFFKTFNLSLNIIDQIKKLGFAQLDAGNLVYSRPDQQVWRQVHIFSFK